MKAKVTVLLSLLLLLILAGCNSGNAVSPTTGGHKVCIDPGHGGTDRGAHNDGPGPATTIYEKNLTLEIATKLQTLLERQGDQVIMTRRTDMALENSERAVICNNAHADILLSIHLDGDTSDGTDHSGALYGTGQSTKDLELATTIDQNIKDAKLTSHTNPPDEFAGGVLLSAIMPATLAEPVFLTSMDEYKHFTEDHGQRQQKIANALLMGIENWFKKYPQHFPVPTPTADGTCPPGADGVKLINANPTKGSFCHIFGPTKYSNLIPFGLSGNVTSIENFKNTATGNYQYRITLYELSDFGGESITYEGDALTNTLLKDGWNNRARSLRIERRLGGTWITPGNDFTVQQGQTLQLSAHAYTYSYPPRPGIYAPPIAYVQFTAYWNGVNSAQWPTVHRVYPTTNTGVFSYTWDLTYQGQPVPLGSLQISFDVYDEVGNTNLAPQGIHPGTITSIAPPTPTPTPIPTPTPTPKPGPTPTPTPTIRAQSVQVNADVQWVNTGIVLGTGDRLTISATGSWSVGPTDGSIVPADGFTTPDGFAHPYSDNFLNLADLGVCASCASTDTPHWGALIGYIGDSPPQAGSYTSADVLQEAQRVFFVGSAFRSSGLPTGTLWLAFNDDAYSANTSDNAGQVIATITLSSSQASTPTTDDPSPVLIQFALASNGPEPRRQKGWWLRWEWYVLQTRDVLSVRRRRAILN